MIAFPLRTPAQFACAGSFLRSRPLKLHCHRQTGPCWKSDANHLLNRGKTSLRVDLKSDAGRERVWELVKRADVVIENFSPGVMRRLSLSAETVRAANPRCVYVSMPGFRSSDTTKAELKAFEAIIMTECKLSRLISRKPPWTQSVWFS